MHQVDMFKSISTMLLYAFILSNGLLLSAQNKAIDIEMIEGNPFSYVNLYLDNQDTIQLKTHSKSSEIKCVDYYADESYCLALFEYATHHQTTFLVLAAYECNGQWFQDYILRSIFKSHTGMSCSHIHHLSIIDGQTLYIEYQVVSESLNFDYYLKSNIQLGKYSLYETQANQFYSYCIGGKGTELEYIQDQSPRPKYVELK